MTVPNFDALKKRRAGRGGSGWRPREGANRIRILPPRARYLTAWDQMEDLSISYKMHFFRIEGKPTEVSRCLEQGKQRCPACDTWRAYRKSDDLGLKELAKQVAPTDQYLFNVLDINNLQAGIQTWGANYTCWDKIMEIAANPAWGNVVDPANGINFEITMTPGSRSRTGFNQYSVTPEPQRTTVMPVLDGIADWQVVLDALETHINEAKEADEVTALLQEMGFPPAGGTRAPSAGPRPAPVGAPAPVAAPAAAPANTGGTGGITIPAVGAAPVAVPAAPVAAPVPVAVPTAAPSPAPVSVAAVEEPRRVDVASVFAGPRATQAASATAAHYDPGPEYQPKVADAARPDNAPRCFGDYAPTVHRCQPCPVIADCQMKMLGIDS